MSRIATDASARGTSKLWNAMAGNKQLLFRTINAQGTARDYLKGQQIFAHGAKEDSMFCIRNGYVKLTVHSNSGKTAVVAILRSGDVFGEGCVARQSLRMCTATAIQQSTISRVERPTIVRIINRDLTFAKAFISFLLLRMSRIEEEFADQMLNFSEKRLARILLMLAGSGQSNREPILEIVTQKTLAEMVGTTRALYVRRCGGARTWITRSCEAPWMGM